jgi:PAS domain-containing protein
MDESLNYDKLILDTSKRRFMTPLQQITPRPKKNLFLIRMILGLILICFAYLFLQAHPEKQTTVLAYTALLLFSFILFFTLSEEKFEKIELQYVVFSMDFVFLLGGLYLFDHFETNLLIMLFLTFFISALSQSPGRSLIVSIPVISLYVYLVYLKSEVFNNMDPVLYLSCALLLVVAIHAGYLAYRAVQREKEIVDLAKKANLLAEKVREGDQAALEYASTLKNVLDSLPIGAIAVSTKKTIIFVNSRVGKLLDLNPRSLLNLSLEEKNTSLGEIGETMVKALRERKELKREYLDILWKGKPKRFRLDSSDGAAGPNEKVWGTLFVLQESTRPATDAPAPKATSQEG